MPELPEVETVRAGLEQTIAGLTIDKAKIYRHDLRQPLPKNLARQCEGQAIKKIARRAKYLWLHLGNGQTLVIHLGMSGRVVVSKDGALRKHDHVIFTLSDGSRMVFNDSRRFGLILLLPTHKLAEHKLFVHLGPEPLSRTFSPAYLKRELARRQGPLKPALMDQRLVVGVGNIYASEALFEAGISPQCSALKAADHASRLVPAIRKVLKAAIRSGGSTLRDYVRSSGDIGYFQHRFKVYDREGMPCRRCKTPIQRVVMGGRSTYYCPSCQN